MTTIYHIPGVKIGSTYRDPAIRVKEQGYTEFEILEVHESESIASDRERELQAEYGYRVDKTNRLHQVYVAGKASRTPEAIEKKRAVMKGKSMSAEHKAKVSNAYKARKDLNWGYGRQYIELNSGVSGYAYQLKEKFQVKDVAYYAKRDMPIKWGPNKGLHFRIL